MSDRPILFSAPMVRALLEGRKTQTRRVLTFGNSWLNGGPWLKHCRQAQWDWEGAWVDPGPSPIGNPGPYLKLPFSGPDDDVDFGGTVMRIYPRVQVADRLWVRETWADVNTDRGPGLGYRADCGFIQPEYDGPDEGAGPSYNYEKYPGNYSMWFEDLLNDAPDHGWRPSIHMPRWASRLTLTVTDVRVERLQDISESDAIAEGITLAPHRRPNYRVEVKTPNQFGAKIVDADSARSCFMRLWQSIHGPDAWDANPWVVSLTFDVHKGNIDA